MRLQVYNFYWINYAKSKKEMILNKNIHKKWKQNGKKTVISILMKSIILYIIFLHHLSLSDLKCNTFRMHINSTMCMWARYNNKNRKRKAFAVGFEYIGFSWFERKKQKIKIKKIGGKRMSEKYILLCMFHAACHNITICNIMHRSSFALHSI